LFALAFPEQIAVHVSVQHSNRTMPQGERSMTVHDRVRAAMALIALPGPVNSNRAFDFETLPASSTSNRHALSTASVRPHL
jgi:hypothetical protein